MPKPSFKILSTLRSRWAGPLLLLVLVAAANYNIVFLGETLVATSNYDPVDYGISHVRPGRAQGSFAIGNWHDLGVAWWQWEPAGRMFSKAFRAGRVPLWDSSIGGGIDSHVSVTQGQYYLPYILLLLAGDTPVLRDIYYLLQIFAAGLFCYLLLRSYGCRVISSTTMGLAFMLGGSLTQTVNSIEGQSVAVLPAMVWAINRVCRVGSWRAAAASSLFLATAALSSFLPIVISGYLLVGIFVVIEFAWDRFAWRQWSKPIAAILASVCLTGFLLVPLHFAGQQDEVFAKWYPGSGLLHFPVDNLLTLVSPLVSFNVNQTFGATASQLFSPNPETSFFYVGLVPFLLAFLAFPRRNGQLRKLYFFFVAATLFLLFKLLGFAPAQWIGYLPVFRDLHFIPYFCGALNFAVAGLAGLGVEQLMCEPASGAVGVGIMGVVGVFTAILRFAQTEALNPLLKGVSLSSAVAHYGMEIARLLLLSTAFIALLFLRRAKLSSLSTGVFLLALVFLDLAPLSARMRFLRSDVWSDAPDYIRFLQSDKSTFRVHSTEDFALEADTSQAFGLDVLSSRQSFNSTRYTSILRKYFGTPFIPYPLAKSLLPNARPVLDLLNVKYVVVFSPTAQELETLNAGGLFARFQDRRFQVFQNKTVWPRAYLASSVRVAATSESCLDALGNLQAGEVVREQQPGAPPPPAISPPGNVEAIHLDFDTIELQVHALRPALLVLDENYAPGWRAEVQGRPVAIQRANYAFQSVVVPQGDSEVQFHYVPEGLFAGLGVTSFGFVLVASMMLAPFAARRLGGTQ